MGLTSPTPQQLLTEAIVFWGIGLVLFVGRIWARAISHGSFKRLQADDYVMMVTFCFYTTLMVLIQVSARYATNLMDPADYASVMADPQEIAHRIYGSKIVIPLEQCMLNSTWGAKTCLLILYHKMTTGLPQRIYVKVIAGYVLFGYVVIQITYYGVYCRPFSQYWALPVGNLQCATYQHYSITQAVFNISSDVMMLAVPIPLVRRAQIPLKRKFLLIGVFSLGIFVIIAAILNKYFNFSSPLTTTYMIWYIRESSTAIYVTNLMCWWPLLRKFFGLRAFSGLSSGMNAAGTPGVGSGKGFSNLGSSTTMHSRIREFKQRLADTKNSSAMMGEDDTIFRSTGSEEAINKPNTFQNHREETDSGSARGDAVPLEIWHKQEYHVEKSAAVLESPVDTKKFDHKSSGGSNYNATVDITSLPDRKGSP